MYLLEITIQIIIINNFKGHDYQHAAEKISFIS